MPPWIAAKRRCDACVLDAMACSHGGRAGQVARQARSGSVITLRDVLVGIRGTLDRMAPPPLARSPLHASPGRRCSCSPSCLRCRCSCSSRVACGRETAGRTHIGLPAILPAMRRSYLPAHASCRLSAVSARDAVLRCGAGRSSYLVHARGGLVSRAAHRDPAGRVVQHDHEIRDEDASSAGSAAPTTRTSRPPNAS